MWVARTVGCIYFALAFYKGIDQDNRTEVDRLKEQHLLEGGLGLLMMGLSRQTHQKHSHRECPGPGWVPGWFQEPGTDQGAEWGGPVLVKPWHPQRENHRPKATTCVLYQLLLLA